MCMTPGKPMPIAPPLQLVLRHRLLVGDDLARFEPLLGATVLELLPEHFSSDHERDQRGEGKTRADDPDPQIAAHCVCMSISTQYCAQMMNRLSDSQCDSGNASALI